MTNLRLKALVLGGVSCLLGGAALLASHVAGAQVCTNPTSATLIGQDWLSLGGASGVLGSCSSNEENDGAGGRIQMFANGGFSDWIYPESAAYACWGPNATAWASEYGGSVATGQLVANMSSFPISPQNGEYCAFQLHSGPYSGAMTYVATSGYGTFNVYGTIGQAWYAVSQGAYGNFVPGMPHGNAAWNGAYQIQVFDYQYITYNSSTGGTCVYSNGTRSGTDGELFYHWSGGACGSPPLP